MFKKILALFLFACLLLSAAGCGNEQQPAEESGSSRETVDVTNGDDSRNTTEEAASSPSEQEDATSTTEDEPDSVPVQETTEPVRPEPQVLRPYHSCGFAGRKHTGPSLCSEYKRHGGGAAG